MGDDGGAARVAEPTSLAAAAQPFAQNRRRQSARLNEDEDVELVALTQAQLPADSQRSVLDAKPVDENDLLQVGSRVSCQASCFDHMHGVAWSRLTFGEDGGTERIFGTVKELLDNSGGHQRKITTYRVGWDIPVPHHDH